MPLDLMLVLNFPASHVIQFINYSVADWATFFLKQIFSLRFLCFNFSVLLILDFFFLYLSALSLSLLGVHTSQTKYLSF